MMSLSLLLAVSLFAKTDASQVVGSPGEHQESIAGFGLWTFFGLVVTVALVLDHLVAGKYAQKGSAIRGAIVASCAWVGLGLGFAVLLMVFKGAGPGFTFLTGYLLEESLSVDNLVVIALIFRSFRIKAHDQGPVLKWGIIGAVVFRLIFVFAGVWLLEHIHSMIYIFGAILLWSAYKMYVDDDDDDTTHDHSKGNSLMMRIMTFFIPYHADSKSHKFIEYIDGRAVATPMLAALVIVELSDLIFAVDSIPCILGLTHDLFLVFSSNVFAILGLRSLYLLLAEALDKVQNLKTGLAYILGFVGIKMMLGDYFPLPQSLSLLVIFGILGATVAKSMRDAGLSMSKGLSTMRTAEMILPM
jgi:tellurite resistance protein TerC|mmetsp:Transcript_77149/g.121837  ORF Transcript_77149/g.121837 Transcript_77149/m.121837 type:complete len:358 (-) Transcript_77149:90-1163(-)